MAHNFQITIHSIEQAEELSRRLQRYLTNVDKDFTPAAFDFRSSKSESAEKKVSRLQRDDSPFWSEISALLNFLICKDIEEDVLTEELSEDDNRMQLQHYFIPKLSEYLMDTHFGLNYCSPVVLEILLKLDLLPGVLQLLKVRPSRAAMESFTSVTCKGADHWLSVHYHSIRMFCYLLNAFQCKGREEPRSRRPLVKLMEYNGGIQTLLKCVENCINPKADTAFVIPGMCALGALYDMFDIEPRIFGKLLTTANGIHTLGYLLYRDNALKVLSRILKRDNLYKFEDYALKTSPWYIVPRSASATSGEDVEEHFDEMSAKEIIYLWAHYLRLYSASILEMTICDDVSAKKIVMEDKLCIKAIMDWFKCPQLHQRDQVTIEFMVKLVFYLVQCRDIAQTLVTKYHLLKVLEAVVFYPNGPVIIHSYLEIIACLLNEPSLKDKVVEKENLVFAMSTYAFSIDEKVRNMSLTNLLRMSRTNKEGSKHLMKHFGPHEIYVYRETFIKTKPKWKSLLKDYSFKLQITTDEILVDTKTLNHSQSVALKEEGNKCFKHGQFSKAIELYNHAIHVCPYVRINADDKKRKHPYLWDSLRATLFNNRAQCYMNLKKYNEALNDCNTVIALSGHEETEETGVIMLKGLYRRARTLYELKFYHRSLADISKCLLMDKNDKFKDFMGKVLIRYRKRYGTETLLCCDECGESKVNKTLRRCKRCTAAYCSRVCQAKAWGKFHKANCEEFNQEYPEFGK
ncbi:uncharacterized protein LOC117101832 [Anneissia japonica]|uniref:uncharacterized protein LOC117101832 n=1 Tax=Anneissia japonica TaxID=1529436 RepID=UPI0014259546|nr:uncharacterized protein LOC117101832 [Anneissia japonica]